MSEKRFTILITASKKFAENTSFPGVGLISKARNPIRRLVWITFLILGTSMAIYQSWDLIKEYRTYRVFSYHSENDSLLWPSLTFCPPLPVLWNEIYPNHTIFKELKNFLNRTTNYKNWKKIEKLLRTGQHLKYDLMGKLMQLVYELDESERSEILPELNDVIYYVRDSYRRGLESYFISTYIPAFGRCFTFNPGLPASEKLTTNKVKEIVFFLLIQKRKIPPMAYDENVVVNLHASGTAPEVNHGEKLELKDGDWFEYTIEIQKEYQRLDSPYPSNCIKENSVNLSLFFSEDRPYKYERGACKDKHHYDRKLERRNCSEQWFPPQSTNLSICDRFEFFDESYDCQLSCNSVIYDWHRTEKRNDPPGEGALFMHLKLRMKSNQHDVFTEQPRYSFSDIVGAIGGNIGIWIGFSLISMMEIFDFTVRIFFKIMSMVFNRNTTQTLPEN